MNLTIDDLKSRHQFWRDEIHRAGIWDKTLFLPVDIVIRKKSRNYNGIFSRRTRRTLSGVNHTDKLVIYKNSDDFDEKFLDSVLVHEMIHQYIIQNKFKDSSTHGRLFKSFMTRINARFVDRLKINIRGHNPSLPLTGKGSENHLLLILYKKDCCWCCVVHPAKTKQIESLVKHNKRIWGVRTYSWCCSDDIYFSHYTRCCSSIHGIKIPINELSAFCDKYRIKEYRPED